MTSFISFSIKVWNHACGTNVLCRTITVRIFLHPHNMYIILYPIACSHPDYGSPTIQHLSCFIVSYVLFPSSLLSFIVPAIQWLLSLQSYSSILYVCVCVCVCRYISACTYSETWYWIRRDWGVDDDENTQDPVPSFLANFFVWRCKHCHGWERALTLSYTCPSIDCSVWTWLCVQNGQVVVRCGGEWEGILYVCWSMHLDDLLVRLQVFWRDMESQLFHSHSSLFVQLERVILFIRDIRIIYYYCEGGN